MYLDEISVAVSPYIARTHKAIEFYTKHINPNEDCGLYLCLGAGPIDGWENELPDMPSLSLCEIENPIKFKPYSKMYFVNSDVDGKINVGGLSWSRVNFSENQDEYFNNVINNLSRWIYIEFDINRNDIIEGKIRQVGVYSNLKLGTDISGKRIEYNPNILYNPNDFAVVNDNIRTFDGILELVQNKIAYSKDNSKEIYSYILEF